ALRTASTVGLRGLTIGGLAEQTSMSKSGLFAHFKSKEQLQCALVEYASEWFVDMVLRPALREPRGEPRLRALFDRWLLWDGGSVWALPGGCVFISAAAELDDEPDGPLRDRFVRNQRDWLDTLATVFRSGMTEGHFDQGCDPAQFAYDLYGVTLAFHHANRLLRDPLAEQHARVAFERLVEVARPLSPA
ncbi:MAG: TetR/AcrR family transcriptional regulator, partial [Geodermatophilaceae bacterium]